MSNITLHKINACRFDYEYMGKSLPELSRIYGFPSALIEQEITSSQWVRRLEPTELPDTRDIELFAKALEETSRLKLSVIALFRQIEQQPLIAEIEKEFLRKALLLASSLDPEDDRAATKLSTLVKAVQTLQDRDPIALAEQVKAAANTGLTVNIMNQIQ